MIGRPVSASSTTKAATATIASRCRAARGTRHAARSRWWCTRTRSRWWCTRCRDGMHTHTLPVVPCGHTHAALAGALVAVRRAPRC
eukprot:2702983-Prymnesium_polylepis.1